MAKKDQGKKPGKPAPRGRSNARATPPEQSGKTSSARPPRSEGPKEKETRSTPRKPGRGPASKPSPGAKPRGSYGKVNKKAGDEEHSSGWRSEAKLKEADPRRAGRTQYRKVQGKTWKGKPVVEARHTMRLNKYISNSGICSRREADDLIAQGLIEVNGKQVTEMGYQVKDEDKVTYAGERISPEKPAYVLLNKPKDYHTTGKDSPDRKTVLMLLRRVGNVNLFPIGKLDRNATGLLLLTNDSSMGKRLSHSTFGAKALYHVHLDKICRPAHMKAVLDGVELEDGMAKALVVEYVADGKDKKQIGVEVQGGKNNVVRRLFEHLGYGIMKIDRVMYGGLTKKDLPRGRWRHLTEQEVNRLKML